MSPCTEPLALIEFVHRTHLRAAVRAKVVSPAVMIEMRQQRAEHRRLLASIIGSASEEGGSAQ